MEIPGPHSVIHKAEYRRPIQANHPGGSLVRDSARPHRYHEYGGVWRDCQDEYGRDAPGPVLYGRQRSLVLLSNLLKLSIQLGLFAVLWIYFAVQGADIAINWYILLTPVLVIMLAGLGLGFGIMVSSLTTKYRDLAILFTFIVQLWMYATPIVYPLSMVQDGTLRSLILANPMTSIVEAFKYATLGQGFFSWLALGYSFLFMCVLLLFSVVTFNKVQRSFMDTV